MDGRECSVESGRSWSIASSRSASRVAVAATLSMLMMWPRITTTCCMRCTVALLVDGERNKRPVAVPRRRAISLKWLCVCIVALRVVCFWAVSNHEIARDLTWN